MQHSSSQHNAFYSTTCTSMQPLQCDLHPHVAEHSGGTDYASIRSLPAAATLHEKNAMFRAPASPPTRVPCNIHAAVTLRFAATRAHSCSHYNAICIHTLQNAMEEPIARRNDPQPPHTGATQELPFIAGCSHFTMFRAMQYSCSHYTAFCSNTCTFMQPLQCDLHRHVAEHHGRTDCASKRPATASHRSYTGAALHRRLQPLYAKKHNVSCHATFMQPLHCVLQQHVHIHAAITMRFASTRCRTLWKNWLRVETARNRLTQELPLTAGCSHFTGLLLRLPPESNPMQHPCIITMRFAASRGKPACIYAHGNRAWKHHAAITLRSAPPSLSHHFLSHNPSSPPFVIP